MKRLPVLLAVLICGIALSANLVDRKPFTIDQPDGTKFEAFISGDEYYHRVHDAAGYTILKHPETGFAVYAIPDGNSIKVSDYVVGTFDPATLGISPNLMKHFSEPPRKLVDQQNAIASGNRASPIGTVVNLVVFVRFADQPEFPATPLYSSYSNYYNNMSAASLKDYYDEVSNGQLTINSILYPSVGAGGVVVSVQLAEPRGYYSPYIADVNEDGYLNEDEQNSRHFAMINEIATLADPLVPDTIDLDNDDDNNIDAFSIIIRGEDDTWGDLLWPLHWCPGPVISHLNGLNLVRWVQTFEGVSNVSVSCHEMGHMLGAPDLYHYSSSAMGNHAPWNTIAPVSQWCLMASDVKQHWLTYMKWKYGTWFTTIPVINPTSTPTTYTLTAIDESPYSCYKVQSSDPDQFYMLEYRRQSGRYETNLPNNGLLVYRVITSHGGVALHGNSGGPPDEVYIYRPGGDVDSNGTPGNATFSLGSGRTALHNYTDPKPWVYADTLSTPDGNLVVTEVGASGGSTITFKISTLAPNTWTGAVSADWNVPGNWTFNAAPTSADDVVIPSGIINYPITSSALAYCRTLQIAAGARLTISEYNLRVYDNMTVNGQLRMISTGTLRVDGSISWESGSSASVSANVGLYCYGSMTFQSGSNVNFTNGFVSFFGNILNSNVYNYSSSTRFYGLRIQKSGGKITTFHGDSSNDYIINSSITCYSGSIFHCDYTGWIKLYGNLINLDVTDPGLLQWNQGSLMTMGSSQSISLANSLDYINNLWVYSSTGLTLLKNLEIKGNLLLQSGTFIAGSNTIKIGGNWQNSLGADHFTETGSTVIFNGTAHQYCDYPETFNNLEVNKTSGAALRLNGEGAYLTCASFNWTAGAVEVLAGSFIANDLTDNGIYGNWFLGGGNIILHNSDGAVDLNGALTISGGIFQVFGGTLASSWPYSANASVTMSGGVIDFADNGITITTGTGYTMTENITGGTIRCFKNFLCNNSGFTPSELTLELYGTADATIYVPAGFDLGALIVNKAATRTGELHGAMSQTRSNTITALSALDIQGDLMIQSGIFNPGSYQIEVGGDIVVNGELAMNSASAGLTCQNDFIWNSTGQTSASAGTLETYGNWLAYSGASIALGAATNTYLSAYYGAQILLQPSDVQFGNLIINGTLEEPRFWIDPSSAASFEVLGNLTVNTGNELDLSDKALTIYLDLTLNGELTVDAGSVGINGRPYLYASSILNITSGNFTWYGSTTPTTTYLYGTLNLGTGTFAAMHHALNIPAGSHINITGGIIKCTTINASVANTFQPSGGLLEIVTPVGHVTPAMTVNNGNWLNNLKLNTTGGITLASNLILTGYMDLYDGNLDVTTSNRNITLAGNWTNYQGEGYFDEQGGSVIFNGEDNQYINGVEIFNIIVNANTGGSIGINNSNYSTTCASYDAQTGGELVEVPFGTFIANDLADNGIYGGWAVFTSGIIKLYNTDGDVDIKGGLNLQGGTIEVHGGTGTSVWANIGNTSIIMSAGTLDFFDQGITINPNGTYGFTESITGGTIRCTGNFVCNNNQFTPTGGTLELYGTTNASLSHVSGANLWSMKINKTLSPSNIVTVTGALVLKGSFALRAGVFTPGGQISVAGNWTNSMGPEAFTEGTYLVLFNGNTEQIIYSNETFYSMNVSNTANRVRLNATKTLSILNYLYVYGNLTLNPGSTVLIANLKSFNVQNGGYLEMIGTLAAPINVSHVSGYFYSTVVNGGSIAAEYVVFEYLRTGLTINSGATVSTEHDFDYCTFRNGYTSQTLFTINNAQSLTIYGAVFPTNTWSGAYNVSKTLDQGTVTFINSTGDYAGESFDNDNFNRINWTMGIPQITSISIIYDSGNVVLAWTNEPAHNNFRIYRSLTLDGTFTQAGTSTVSTWSEPASATHYFYYVVAVQ